MTVLSRKMYEPGGFAYEFLGGKCKPLPPNVALLERDGRGGELVAVTWGEVMARRRKYQADRLLRVRDVRHEPKICPCYVWTFFNRQDIPYHGWYCYVVSRYFDVGVNFRGFKAQLATSIMTAIPLGMLPIEENFYEWCKVFAKAHPRAKHKHDPRKAGSVVGWIADRRTFTLERPSDDAELSGQPPKNL
jgi:hypothetical protein